jgi:hypothetical protein
MRAAEEREPGMPAFQSHVASPVQPALFGVEHVPIGALNNRSIPVARKIETVFSLQRQHGNRYVRRVLSLARQAQDDAGPDPADPTDSGPVNLAPIVVQGTPSTVEVEGGCDGLHLHGSATATFDGGKGRVVNQVVTAAKGCNCDKGVQCLHATGTLVTDYSVSVAITMPSMPSGLTKCEQGIVQNWMNTVLAPHEQEHKTRFMTYNGQTKNPVDFTGCGSDGITSQAAALQASEDTARQAAANAFSGLLDPFAGDIDCSSCQKKDAGASNTAPDSGNDLGNGAGPEQEA